MSHHIPLSELMGFACEPNSIPWPKFKPQKQAACMVNWLDIPRMTHEPDIAIAAIIVKIAISFFMVMVVVYRRIQCSLKCY